MPSCSSYEKNNVPLEKTITNANVNNNRFHLLSMEHTSEINECNYEVSNNESENEDIDEMLEQLKNVNNNKRTTKIQEKRIATHHNKIKSDLRTKVPPLNVFNSNIKIVKELIKNKLKINDFEIKRYNNDHFIVKTYNLEDFKNVKEMLKKGDTEHFTNTPKEEKVITLLLKNLGEDYDVNEVEYLLKENENDEIKFIKVTRLTTKRSIENNRLLPHFIVQADPKSNINAIKQIKYLDHTSIKWEDLKKPLLQQCRRCQRFGHTAVNCNMQFRCVKCAKSHEPGNCSITEQHGKESLSCVLCGQVGHPASYRNCPVYKRKLREREETRNSAKASIMQRQKMYNNFITPNQNFSSVLKGNSSQVNNSFPAFSNSESSNTNQLLLELTTTVKQMNARVEQNSNFIQQLFEICSKLSNKY
jgi:hypothetical protein